jgi:hypothetical protein
MKRIIYLLLTPLVIFSCKKDNNSGPQKPFDFTVSGFPDTAVAEQIDTLDIPFSVDLLSGSKERVVLMVSNLPVSMTAGFAADIDTPTFATHLRLITHSTDTGIYSIRLTASSSKIDKHFDLQVHVVPNPVNPATPLVGNYQESGPCTLSGNIHDTVTVATITNSFNKVQLTGLWTGNTATKVDADVDPVQQTISIPSQIVDNATYSGNGSYSANQIIINYKVTAGNTTDTCTTVLNRF